MTPFARGGLVSLQRVDLFFSRLRSSFSEELEEPFSSHQDRLGVVVHLGYQIPGLRLKLPELPALVNSLVPSSQGLLLSKPFFFFPSVSISRSRFRVCTSF